MKRIIGIWLLVILGGILFEIGYFRWWVAILVTPLPIALAFALCRSRWGCLLFALTGGFVALRIQQDKLATYDHLGATLLILISAVTLIPVAWAIHEGVRRGFRMAWVLPVAWVGAETLRLIGPLGLPFAVLGFACHEQVGLIQVADIGGPLLLSFAIAAANGVALDALLKRGSTAQRIRYALVPGGLAVVVAWGALLAYGQVRIRQVDTALHPGLRIAVVQSDAILFQDPAKNYDGRVLLAELMAMSEALRAEHQRLLAEVERPRAVAGIQGYAIRDTSTTSLRTPYQRGGHYFPFAVLAALLLFLMLTLLRPVSTINASK